MINWFCVYHLLWLTVPIFYQPNPSKQKIIKRVTMANQLIYEATTPNLLTIVEMVSSRSSTNTAQHLQVYWLFDSFRFWGRREHGWWWGVLSVKLSEIKWLNVEQITDCTVHYCHSLIKSGKVVFKQPKQLVIRPQTFHIKKCLGSTAVSAMKEKQSPTTDDQKRKHSTKNYKI